ncbi:MAG: hypothetical protein H8D67_17385 [Deltaproteobacteria bacterium]|nr:hypothetical protein [Deltaproteobacteria bacterium]
MKKFFRNIWNGIDGKKTVTGVALVAIGGLMYLTPVTAGFATEVLVTGVSTAVGGLIHKGYKLTKRGDSK